MIYVVRSDNNKDVLCCPSQLCVVWDKRKCLISNADNGHFDISNTVTCYMHKEYMHKKCMLFLILHAPHKVFLHKEPRVCGISMHVLWFYRGERQEDIICDECAHECD